MLLTGSFVFASRRAGRPGPQCVTCRIVGNTVVTTKFALAQDYPGSTIKNKLGPRNPHMLNTPFTNVSLDGEMGPSIASTIWGKPAYHEPTAGEMFVKNLEAKKGTVVFSPQGPYVQQ